jgi:hypothetical protein
MSNSFIIRDYRSDDFDAVTILWRVSREKSLPEFQRAKGHFFYEDQEYFRDHVLKENKVFVVESDQHPVETISSIICMFTPIINSAASEGLC